MQFCNATKVSLKEFYDMLDSWQKGEDVRKDLFWVEDSDEYIVIDNKSGDFFVERFKTPNAAKAWLEGADTDYCYEIDMKSANNQRSFFILMYISEF